jgi:hypothetical protein
VESDRRDTPKSFPLDLRACPALFYMKPSAASLFKIDAILVKEGGSYGITEN